MISKVSDVTETFRKEFIKLSKEKPIICIAGPTASGKTDLAMKLRESLNADIISVDSAMIYKGMDIGTAKPTDEELKKAPHHLINICEPTQSYSSAEFRQDALSLVESSYRQGRWPLLVGGTMLYFKTLLSGIAELPATNEEIRQEVTEKLNNDGPAKLHQWLEKIDPVTAKRLHPNDPQRISRAIEVFLISGKTLSQWHEEQKDLTLPYQTVKIAIAPKERAILHKRIETRFDQMLAQGFEEEVRGLFNRNDLNETLPSMRCVGYRQMWQYFKNEISLEEARFRSIVSTRQLAKRQFTWLRSWNEVEWIDSLSKNTEANALKIIGNIAI